VLPNGQVAITGWSNSSSLWTSPGAAQPAYSGGFDCYQAVLDPQQAGAQQLVAATWWGGTSDDVPGCIVHDHLGRLVVGGFTPSVDCPMTANALQTTYQGGALDGFVVCFDTSLSALLYSTYLGGPSHDQANDLAVDPQGRLVIGNWTGGFSFAMPPGAWQSAPAGARADGYALLLDPSLPPSQQVVWGTYIGGTMEDGVNGIARDSAGRITVVGVARGTAAGVTNFPQSSWPLQAFVGGPGGTTDEVDAFVARFDPRRQGQDQLVYSTCFGGASYEYGYDVVLDERARPIVTGPTGSVTFLNQTSNGLQDVFLVQLDLLANVADRFGGATPACAASFADAYHRQTPSGFDLTLCCSGAPPATPGVLLLGFPEVAGTPVPQLGVTSHLQLGQPLATAGVFVSDAAGFASHRFTVNGIAPPTGIAAQWAWFGGCASLVASDALRL
jgi:hypothetical protein